MYVCNSCSVSQQNSLLQMTLDLLFEVVVTAVRYSTEVSFASLIHVVIIVTVSVFSKFTP